MQDLTPEGRRVIDDLAQQHGFSPAAVTTLARALASGNGTMAQFDHPQFGGMGQWSAGGMIMIGDMFNNGLKHRVDALCRDLARHLHDSLMLAADATSGRPAWQDEPRGDAPTGLFGHGGGGSGRWWPVELGQPGASGAQNDLRYASFPGTRRLAVRQDGHVTVYDTGDHRIGGFSQQQGADQSLTFTSQLGTVRVADLPVLDDVEPITKERTKAGPASKPTEPIPEMPAPGTLATATSAATTSASGAVPPTASDDIIATIERLAELNRKGIVGDAEFTAKKTELLGRL